MAPPTPAADALFAEHAPALRNFLGARCRDPDLAADLLQETAARLVAAGPRLDANGNPRGYLFRIAANVWRDHLRREIVRRRTLDALRQEGGAGGGGLGPQTSGCLSGSSKPQCDEPCRRCRSRSARSCGCDMKSN